MFVLSKSFFKTFIFLTEKQLYRIILGRYTIKIYKFISERNKMVWRNGVAHYNNY